MRSKTKLGLLVALCFVVAPILVSAPVSADHATCSTTSSTSEDDVYCQATMDWRHIFDNTEILSGVEVESSSDSSDDDLINGDFVNPVEGLDETDTLLVPTRQEQRNLYQGIWDSRAPPNNELMVGSYTDNPRDIFYSSFTSSEYSTHWVDGESTSNNVNDNEPNYLSTSYFPDWWGITHIDGFDYADPDDSDREEPNDSIVLDEGYDRAEFATWDEGTGSPINPVQGSVQEFTWDFGTWNYEGEFDPSVVALSGSVPEDTEIRFEIYEPVEPSTLRDAESNGNLDDYRLGVAEFDDSGGVGNNDVSQISSAIRHGDDNELGLKEAYAASSLDDLDEVDNSDDFSTYPGGGTSTDSFDDVITYNARFVMKEDPVETKTTSRVKDDDNEDLNGFEEGETIVLRKTPVVEIISAEDGSGDSVSVNLEDSDEGTVTVQDSGFEDIEIKYRHDDVGETPAVSLGSSVQLGTPIPSYRRGSDPWKGYPSVLPSLSGQAERGELYNVTHIRNEDYALDLGHTEAMVVNFGKDYLDGSVGEGLSSTDGDYSMTSSFAPRIPQDGDPSDDDQPNSTDRFYHGAVGEQDYHLLSPENMDSDSVEHPQVVFHHVYTEVPRVEMSTFWQKDGYEDIEEDEWGVIASEDGVMYSMMDGATNEISYSNSNIRYFDHETEDTERKYNGFTGSDGVDSSDLPDYTKNDGYDESDGELETPVIKMDYEIEDMVIQPEVGADYDYNVDSGGGPFGGLFGGFTLPFRQDLTDESFRESESFVFDYDQEVIEEGKTELSNSERVENQIESLNEFMPTPVDTDVEEEDLEFDGFYSLVNDTRVTYNIDYEMYEFDSSVCPEHYTEVDVDRYDSDGPGDPPIYEEGDIKDISAENSYAVNSYHDHPDADSDIYSSYDDALEGEYPDEYGEYYGIDDASGLKGCDVSSGETSPDEEYITEGDWEDIDYDSYEHPDAGEVEDLVEHDNGTQVSYNSSDSKIHTLVNGEEVEVDDDDSDDSEDDGLLGGFFGGGGDDGSTETELQLSLDEDLGSEDITKDSYQIDKFGYERADEQGPSDGDISDSFSVDTAIGQSEFKGKNRFNRDFEDGLENTRWTRAEATASVKRETIRFDQLGGSRNITLPVDAEYGIEARYNEPKDITSTKPLRYEIKEGMDVYLDIYNYGPSQSENEEFEVKVNDATVYETSNLPDSDAGSTFGGDSYNTYNKIDQIDITEQVMGKSEINMTYNYSIPESEYDEETAEEISSDIDQRIDYVITIDTNHPIQHMSSRWGYSTFRDTRFDVTYEFKSSSCVTDSSTDCYNYQSHSVPAGDLDGNRNHPVDPSNGNPVETTYPSNSMIVHPYLVPTTESLEISNPLGAGVKTRPTENLTHILNEDKISYDDRFEDSGIEVESDGNFIAVEQANTIIEPVNEDIPASEPQTYESINFHDWYPEYKSDVEDLDDFEPMDELPEHRSLSSFPAMMLYGEDNLEDNYETLQDVDMGKNGDDVEVHEMWFEDGKVRINATVHNPSVLPFGIDANFVILDFPQTTVNDWPSHDGISDTVYEEGILFGGYFYQDFDKVTREDVEDSGLEIFSDPDGLIEEWEAESSKGQLIEGTYAAQDQSWVAEAEEVRTELEGSDRQVRLNKIDLSPLNSTYCPYNPNMEQRYCGMDKVSLADFNIEYAYRDEVRMPEHIDGFRPPKQGDRQESGFAEYGSFELETGGESVTSWNIAGDASWETREISSDTGNYKMFDATRISVQPVNVTEDLRDEYELSPVDHEFASESEMEDDSVQQYKLKLVDQQGVPISFKDRTAVTAIVDNVDTPVSEYDKEYLSSSDDGGKKEGVCIDVSKGGTKEESGSYYDDCYMTGDEGELYFTLSVDDDEYDVDADEAPMNVRVVGSEQEWWTYDSGKRLIESSQTTFNTDSLDSDGGSSGATLAQAIIYLLIIIVIFLFVLSLILRIGTNPSQGPTTKDLLNIMFAPFVRPVVKRLGRMLIYFTILSIGVAVLVSATTDADISYFFFIEGIARGLYETFFA